MSLVQYTKCVNDIKIAEIEIKKMKMYPENIIADFYCIPSHNHKTYFAILSKENNNYFLTYIRNEIYTIHFETPIKMYTFSDCKAAEKHPAKKGQFIIGRKNLTQEHTDKLLFLIKSLPEKFIASEDGICLDGVLQIIRVFGKATKEIFYYKASEINGLPSDMIQFLDDLYIEIEDIIS